MAVNITRTSLTHVILTAGKIGWRLLVTWLDNAGDSNDLATTKAAGVTVGITVVWTGLCVIIGVDMVTTGRVTIGDLILIPRLGLIVLLFVASVDVGLFVVFVAFVLFVAFAADLRFAACRKFCTPCSCRVEHLIR